MRIYFSFFLIYMQFFCFGQDSFQSLKKDLEQKIIYSDFKKALAIINKNREFYGDAEKNDLDVMKIKILTEFGLYDEAFKLSQNLISNSEITEEQKLKIHVERALIYEINNDNKACLPELEKAESILFKHPEFKFKNYTNFLIRKSSYYRVNGFSKKAYFLAIQAKNYADSVNDKVNMPVVELILGLGNRKINSKTELLHYHRALYLYKKLNHYEAVISMYCNLSYFYLSRNEYKMANVYIDSAIAISSRSNVLNYKADVFQTKSDILEKQNKADSALYYYKIASELFKKYNGEQRDLKVKELETEYNFEKEKSEKQLLKKDMRTTRMLNTTLFVSILILSFFTWQIKKNKRKIEIQKQKISENNSSLKANVEEKQFLVQELNHRVKNNLAVILSLIDFQKDQAKNENYKNRFDDLYQRIKTIVIAHEFYSYSVNYNDNALIEAPNYINKIIESHQNSSIRTFKYRNDIESIYFNVDKVLSLGLLVNELVTNSIKHATSENGKLVLHLELRKTNKDEVELNYSDNGTVFNFEKNNDSLGLLIIEGMIKQLKGNCKREDANYKIIFPND
ncbi:sensor histidine kinase [Flavobacterium piscis]|uniref:histidine kinase n=1 Tax=Flavobacterium piscis TaxID=1114874 RepID=A0ABU1YC03_9FLAO|nr:sensor histidine kinase [Flavobacterium piscis]MDR7211767.1 two-component sensor histidine kinase [Flavobacterium piscis]